jgi:hypothetical protein
VAHPVGYSDRLLIVSHLVDTYGDRQDEDIILPGLDLHTVGIAQPEPLLGKLSHLIPALANGHHLLSHLVVAPAIATAAPLLAFFSSVEQNGISFGVAFECHCEQSLEYLQGTLLGALLKKYRSGNHKLNGNW